VLEVMMGMERARRNRMGSIERFGMRHRGDMLDSDLLGQCKMRVRIKVKVTVKVELNQSKTTKLTHQDTRNPSHPQAIISTIQHQHHPTNPRPNHHNSRYHNPKNQLVAVDTSMETKMKVKTLLTRPAPEARREVVNVEFQLCLVVLVEVPEAVVLTNEGRRIHLRMMTMMGIMFLVGSRWVWFG
jgi:hypothetical protein